MGDVGAIYAALAGMTVSVGVVTPAAYYGDTLPSVVDTARLPCRLLLPPGMGIEAGLWRERALKPLALGGGSRVTWRIVDLLLWDAAGRGRGMAQHGDSLADYCAAYLAAATANAQLVRAATLATVENVQFAAGLVAYPEGSEARFYGVRVTVEVREVG